MNLSSFGIPALGLAFAAAMALAQADAGPKPPQESAQGVEAKPAQSSATGQVVGLVVRVSPMQGTIELKPPGSQIQQQSAPAPHARGGKPADGRVVVITVTKDTVFVTTGDKGAANTDPKTRTPVKPPVGEERTKPSVDGEQGGKPPTSASQNNLLTGLEVGQIVRVVHVEKDGKICASRIQVLKQATPADRP